MKIMEIEIISEECIKPSLPTPHHLKTHKLSLLDQFIPSIYIPFILFYPMNKDNTSALSYSERSLLLKQTLSETLTPGVIKDRTSVDCNDEGAYYVEARTSCCLIEYLSQPDHTLLGKFLPSEASWFEPMPGSHVSMIQETTFACGGFVIGVFISHVVGDGTSVSSFLNSWAATVCNAGEEIVYPNFDAPAIFPQSDEFPFKASMIALCSPFFKTAKATSRRFVFDASAIASLKAEATSTSLESPTRVEAVSALLCKCIRGVFKAKSETPRQTLITHAVNLRRKAVPAFPACTMGNFLWLATVLNTNEEANLPGLASQLREAIARIDCEFVKNLQGDGGFLRLCEAVKQMRSAFGCSAFSGGADYISFTSWCNMGLYDIDFGWGRPQWATCVGSGQSETLFINCVVLMDMGTGKGVETWVFLDENDMAKLELDKELLSYASVEPSPLKLGA